MTDRKLNRRTFLGYVAGASGAMALPIHLNAQDLPKVAPDDPQAIALGYKEDTADVDAAKYPNWTAEQNCANCQLIQGADGEEWRPCPIFPGKSVAANGWCSAWVKKVG